MEKNVEKKHEVKAVAVDTYAGVAVDVADNEKVTPDLVKERTKALNDNPRDNNLDE